VEVYKYIETAKFYVAMIYLYIYVNYIYEYWSI